MRFRAPILALLLLSARAEAATPAVMGAIDATVASADGVPVRYHAEGKGDPALVFIHGWSCDRHYWDAQVPRFAKTHRVVTLDLGGHGESGLERKAWTVPAFGDDVRAVVEALDLKRVVLVGHSMGGPVSLEAARKMPGRVVAVIPVDIFTNVERKLSDKEREEFIGPMRADFAAATRNFVGHLFARSSDPALVARITAAMSSRPPAVGVGAMEGLWAFDSRAALADVKVPIRCINSDRRPTDVAAARRYAPRFDAVLMKGVGHFVMMEDPATFDRLLEQAVKDLVPPAAPK